MAGLVRKPKNGFASFFEVILTVSLLALGLTLMTMPWEWHEERHEADVLTRELAVDLQRLRTYSMANSLWKESNYSIYFKSREYVMYKGYIVLKRRPYPEGAGVAMTTMKEFRFNEEGRPTKDMHITVETAEAAYSRKIIVAAQTGRIRVE